MARMLAGDGAEVQRMYSEKVFAAGEAWNAMAMQAMLENQKFGFFFMQSAWDPWLRVLGKGMAPVRRRAVANAKRLGRARRR